MPENEILRSIGDVLVAIDGKLEKFALTEKKGVDERTEEVKHFFDNLALIVSEKFIGDLPGSIELLEKQIAILDFDIKENWKNISEALIKYEKKLKEHLKNELQADHQENLAKLDQYQKNNAEGLKDIAEEVGRLTNTIGTLTTEMKNFCKAVDTACKLMENDIGNSPPPEKRPGFFDKFKKSRSK
jgi:hypothetical protein